MSDTEATEAQTNATTPQNTGSETETKEATPPSEQSSVELKEPIGNIQLFGRDDLFILAKTRNTKSNGPKARILVKNEQFRRNEAKETVVNSHWIEMTVNQAEKLSFMLKEAIETATKLEAKATGSS